MKRFLIGTVIGTALLLSAIPAFAAPPSDGEQHGYSQASNCGADHGAFGYFGNFGYVHDVNGYDLISDGTDDNVGQGAEGGVTGGTGDRNSNACGNPQHVF